MNILIVDDHPLLRHGLRAYLEIASDIRIKHEAETGESALNLLLTGDYDLVVMDVSLPDMDGLEAIRQLRLFNQVVQVLVLSMHAEESLAIRAIHAGADGFVSKDSSPAEILKAIRKLETGGKNFSPEVMFHALKNSGTRSLALPHERLSDREYQVMCLLAGGKSISAIARILERSPNTISTYRARIFEKLGIESNAELTRYAVMHRLIE